MIYGTQPIFAVILVALYLMISSCMATREESPAQQPQQEAVIAVELIANIGKNTELYSIDHGRLKCLVIVDDVHSAFSSTALSMECFEKALSDTAPIEREE